MTAIRSSGQEPHLESAEELVPNIDWYDFLNKVAAKCLEEAKVAIAKGGY
ncbi:MAG TPA: hypothetical protein VKK79_24195 [Candidatus Lokiarchaeia archaeon]|nr:hypothetical protein [Candidatus Lokiarchaeia archaeon]